jgi:hypothetical protein
MYFAGATLPGTSTNPNEDWLAVTPDLVVVLDGATVRTDTGCRHDVAWYARHLGAALIANASQRTDLSAALADAIDHVAGLHPDCDLDHAGTPSAAVAIVRDEGDVMRYLVLGDVSVVFDTGEDQPLVISDNRVSHTAASERAEADQWPIGSPEKGAALLRMKHGELAARNQPGGYWIAASDPDAAHHALVGSVPKSSLRQLAVLSDGAARGVALFEILTWRAVMELLERSGPLAVLSMVRDAESRDPLGLLYPRNKAVDDATAVHGRADQDWLAT